jgi:four helix bundle protein
LNVKSGEKPLGPSVASAGGVNPQAEALKQRTHHFFVDVIKFCRTVPRSTEGVSICAQLIDSAGSADSNYGAACKARSRKQFVDKIGIAAEEADESKRWLEALRDVDLGDKKEAARLIAEADELTSIFVKSHKTARARLEQEAERQASERLLRRQR